MALRPYRVELLYGFKRRKGLVALGCRVEAKSRDDAIDRAIDKHIAPYRARIVMGARAKRDAP